MNKKVIMLFSVIPLCLLAGFMAEAQNLTGTQIKINCIKLGSARELHDFFDYTGEDIPLISGHRGGKEAGFPENSIEALENTLAHTPAFFEIDPRITKDSVIILMHDATLDRTTNGSGKVSDFTWEELQKLTLVDDYGHVTDYKIPTLEEVISWSKGKTIVNLDKKDVPMTMTAALVEELDAFDHVMITVHRPEQARFYLDQHEDFMFSAFIRNIEEFSAYEAAGIPWNQIMAYVGPLSKPENQALYDILHEKGVMVMVSAASSYDKWTDEEEERAAAYRKVFEDGADVLESDYPISVAQAIKPLIPGKSRKMKYFAVEGGL